MNRPLRTTTLAIAIVAFAGGLSAQEKKTDEAKNVAGTWNIEMMSHQIALVLEQDGTKVTGTLMIMGNDMPLKGTFVDSKLTLVGVKAEESGEANHNADHGHSNAAHGDGAAHAEGAEPRPITAMLMEDGTLSGEMQTTRGPVKWTGERLKTKKK